jgi:hypothetical protein
MISEIFYFGAAIICPLIYLYLFQYFKQNLTIIEHYESVQRFHNFLFIFLQLWLSLSIINYLAIGMYLIELLFSLFVISFMYFIYGEQINKLYQSIPDQSDDFQLNKTKWLHEKIICIIIMPMIIMNIIRNYFDTYTIGIIIFNINNMAILLWELGILSLINISSLLNSIYGNNNYRLIVGIMTFYFWKLIF